MQEIRIYAENIRGANWLRNKYQDACILFSFGDSPVLEEVIDLKNGSDVKLGYYWKFRTDRSEIRETIRDVQFMLTELKVNTGDVRLVKLEDL